MMATAALNDQWECGWRVVRRLLISSCATHVIRLIVLFTRIKVLFDGPPIMRARVSF